MQRLKNIPWWIKWAICAGFGIMSPFVGIFSVNFQKIGFFTGYILVSGSVLGVIHHWYKSKFIKLFSSILLFFIASCLFGAIGYFLYSVASSQKEVKNSKIGISKSSVSSTQTEKINDKIIDQKLSEFLLQADSLRDRLNNVMAFGDSYIDDEEKTEKPLMDFVIKYYGRSLWVRMMNPNKKEFPCSESNTLDQPCVEWQKWSNVSKVLEGLIDERVKHVHR